ncbi:MAG: CBS domain-containing protein [Minwuia sp.]|nr:CBS domain-containing protein [Minwuia sp.]
MLVSTLLHAKGGDVAITRPDATVESVVARLKTEKVGALVVSDDGHRINGIVSERDVVRAIANNGCDALKRTAADIMTGDVITCGKDESVAELMRMMTEHRIRHLPVVEANVLCGIISIGDVVKNRVDELQHEADAMRDYIRTG